MIRVLWSFVFLAVGIPANAQFKVVGPPPFSATVARQKIKTLLEKTDPSNSRQTVETLSGLAAWYRDLLDEELIAAWQRDGRANLADVMEPLADARVAAAVVEFSWHQGREAAFNPTYAPMLGNLMSRYPDSGKPFLHDLLEPIATGRPMPDLSEPEAEAVCRILLDMPDIETWKKSALQILPHYRRVTEALLAQDVRGDDQEKRYAALRWQAELRTDPPNLTSDRQNPRRNPLPSPPPAVAPPSTHADRISTPVETASAPVRQPLPAASVAPTYNGAMSGTLKCSGGPIPQNAEYVFRNLPLVNMQLDLDTKNWDARLAPDGQTQKLILRNIGSGPQKHCVVHWSAAP
jgi:hypothetical protein